MLWGSNYLAIKLGLQTLAPFPLLTIRWGLAGIVLFAFAAPRGSHGRDRADDPLGPRQWLATLLLAVLLIGFGNGAVFFATQYLSTSLVALLAGTMPMWAAMWSALVDRRGISLPTAAGILLGIAGLAVLLDPHGAPNLNPVALAVSLAGAVLWAFGSVIARRLALPSRPLVSAAMQMLWVAVFFALVGAALGEWGPSLPIIFRPWAPSFIATFLWLVFGAGLLAYVSYLWLLNHASLALANSYAFVNPAVAVTLGVALLGEPLTAHIVAGTAIVVAAVTLIVLKPPSKASPRPQENR